MGGQEASDIYWQDNHRGIFVPGCKWQTTKMVRNKHNTPVIIKYPFWQMTARNPKATYACINAGEAYAPDEIRKKSICINGDIEEILSPI